MSDATNLSPREAGEVTRKAAVADVLEQLRRHNLNENQANMVLIEAAIAYRGLGAVLLWLESSASTLRAAFRG